MGKRADDDGLVGLVERYTAGSFSLTSVARSGEGVVHLTRENWRLGCLPLLVSRVLRVAFIPVKEKAGHRVYDNS